MFIIKSILYLQHVCISSPQHLHGAQHGLIFTFKINRTHEFFIIKPPFSTAPERESHYMLFFCSLWVWWNQTELTEILFNRRHKVNIHLQAVGVECKVLRDIWVDKKSESSSGSKYMTRLSGNESSKGHSRIKDCINFWKESYQCAVKIWGVCFES